MIGIKIAKAGENYDSSEFNIKYDSEYSNLRYRSISTEVTKIAAGDLHSGFDADPYTYAPDSSCELMALHFLGLKGNSTVWTTQWGCWLHPGTVVSASSVWSGGTTSNRYTWRAYLETGPLAYDVNVPIKTMFFYDKINENQPDVSDLYDDKLGISISNTGENAAPSTPSGDVSFGSKYKNLEIHSIAESAIGTSLTINHNLGYVPFCLVFFKGYGSSRWYQGSAVAMLDGGTFHSDPNHSFQYCMDSSKLYIYTGCGGSQNDTVKYIIFKQRLY